MYRPRARREPTPSRTERYERGGRRTRNARIADRAAKRNVMKDTMLWSPSGAFSVKTPTPTAPAPASKTTIIRIRSLNARKTNQDVARIAMPRRMIEALKIRAKLPMDVPHAEIVMPGAVAHPERLDEGRKDERSIEL